MNVPTRRSAFFFVSFLLVSACSCATIRSWRHPEWYSDYDSAERAGGGHDRGMLIHFTDAPVGVRDAYGKLLADPALADVSAQFLRCRLLKSYEPDRRYLAQFGVYRAPAIVVVRSDGTYHATTKRLTTDGLLAFLDRAKEPGLKPTLNPHIPRRAAYEWQSDLAEASAAAQRDRKPLLIAYTRQLTGDWRHLRSMLKQRTVFKGVGKMAHCRVELWHPWQKVLLGEFGPLRLPALVILHPNRSYDVLEKPTDADAIARFARRSRAGANDIVSTSAPVEPVQSNPVTASAP